MALAAEVAVMVANSHCDAENDQEHHAAIKAVTAALADGPSADDRRQQMNELVEARAKKFILNWRKKTISRSNTCRIIPK